MGAMDSSALIGAVAVIGVIVVISLFRMGVLGKARLPALPEAGPLPVVDLPKYFDLSEPAIAWERVRAWELNQATMSSSMRTRSPPAAIRVFLPCTRRRVERLR